jgi:hypothetical protein
MTDGEIRDPREEWLENEYKKWNAEEALYVEQLRGQK